MISVAGARALGCVFLLQIPLSWPSFSQINKPVIANDDEVISTSICELAGEPDRFKGKTVRVEAEYISDGIHSWILVDPKCRGEGAVRPAGKVHSRPVGSDLLDALQKGCAGTIDKIVTATWTGIYYWAPENTPGTGRVPRGLDVQKIENLKAEPMPGGYKCGYVPLQKPGR